MALGVREVLLRPAQRSPGAELPVELLAERPPALHVERQIDRLVAHPQLRVVWIFASQPPRDLLWGPLQLQLLFDKHPQARTTDELGRPRPARVEECPPVGGVCPITHRTAVAPRTSRQTTDGALRSSTAMAWNGFPAFNLREISSRSSRPSDWPEHVHARGRTPPVLSCIARVVLGQRPNEAAIAVTDSPEAIRSQIWALSAPVNRLRLLIALPPRRQHSLLNEVVQSPPETKDNLELVRQIEETSSTP